MAISIRQQDLEPARKISREARADSYSPYAHKYAGILDGKVVVIADSPEEGIQKLRQIEPDRTRGLLAEADPDHDSVHDIWGS
jgi:hypothetical protein